MFNSPAIAQEVIIEGVNDAGDLTNLSVTAEGHLEVEVHGPRLPFGSLHAEKLTPIFQTDPIYGINTTECRTTLIATGAATVTNGMFKVATGATSGASAILQSRKRLRYRPGQGIIGRFTGLFSAPVASGYQLIGLGSSESGFYFGYQGTTFGIMHITGGVREIQTLTVTTASTATNNYVVTLDGTATNVTATNNSSTAKTAYEISQGTYAGWTAMAVGSTVVFVANAAGNKTNAFSLAQTGAGVPAAGSFVETKAGVSSTDVFIPQSSWNGDVMDGTGASGVTIDPSKGNVFQIGVQYLGFGAITFDIEIAPTKGNNAIFKTVHTIRAPNSRTTPTLSQPSFPFTMMAYSAGSTTDISVSCGSFAGFVEGDRYLTGPRMTYTDSSTAVTTGAYYTLMTIRNDLVYGGRANQAVVKIISCGFAHDDATPVIFYLIKNATLVGTPSFAAHSTNSCTSTDTAATTCTITSNEQIIFSMPVGDAGSVAFAFSDDISLQPGETVTLAAQTVTGTATYTNMSINTREDQ